MKPFNQRKAFFMISLKSIALGAMVVGSACGSASASDTIIAQINDPGAYQDVPELSQFVSPHDYIGMSIVAYHCTGGTDTVTLATGNIPAYPAGTAATESHVACGVGTGWSVHVFTSTSGQLGFCFRGLSPANICGFEILALDSARLVFDRTNPGPGTTGSGWGADANIVNYGYGTGWPGNSDYAMYYIDEVGIMGLPPERDIYSRMYIEFLGGPHDINDVISFTVDMDFVGNRPGDPDPGPNDTDPLRGDINGDGRVNGIDLAEILGMWNTRESAGDLNDDGIVNGQDLAYVLGNWQ